jgi:hypothetical protein
VAVRSLTEPIDTASAMGRFQLQLLAALAELERGLIRWCSPSTARPFLGLKPLCLLITHRMAGAARPRAD